MTDGGNGNPALAISDSRHFHLVVRPTNSAPTVAPVDPQTVEAFAITRPNVTLSLMDDDHQLIANLPAIWRGTARFLGLDV